MFSLVYGSWQNEKNVKSTNMRPIIIIQIQNMNIKLNMEDISKGTLQMQKFSKMMQKITTLFAESCL
jgi:hypothetical protein